MCSKLAALPIELLGQITTHIQTARELSHLGQTCKRIYQFVQQDGFRIFAQTRFPYMQYPDNPSECFWKDACLGLTTLARNWERKAFLARKVNHTVDKAGGYGRARSDRIRERGRQTMGFIPVLDSHEVWYGRNWSSRKEVVAWGGGADLVVRIQTTGSDKHSRESRTMTYQEGGRLEGVDDITSVNILPFDCSTDQGKVIFGRASGGLSSISFSPKSSNLQLLSTYETAGRSVKSASLSSDRNSLLAACLSDASISLYDVSTTESQVCPKAQISVNDPGQSGRVWTSHFLNEKMLAVGCGFSKSPLVLYDVAGGELLKIPMKISDAMETWEGESRLNASGTSVYSIASIPDASFAGREGGNIFLSGSYDGLVRLHDLRCRDSAVSSFRDLVDAFSPIYSLLTIGTERFVAGGGRHSILKVFDLRIPGLRLYHATDADPCSSTRDDPLRQGLLDQRISCCGFHYGANDTRRNWNVFLDLESSKYRGNRKESPVYCLSRPSQNSPSLFAGTESTIAQLDMVSIMDPYPDSVYGKPPSEMTGRRPELSSLSLSQKWNRWNDVACLHMYEHKEGPVQLFMQQEVARLKSSIAGFDERWAVCR